MAAVALLLLNDLLLKDFFPGAFTGKLSDFAGLYAFAVFVCCFRPVGARPISCAVAVAFLFWKSPWSAPAISALNGLTHFQLGRVVDPTDALAIVVLPLAAADVLRALQRPKIARPYRRLAVPLIAFVSLMSFVATSIARYSFEVPPGHPLRALAVEQPPATLKGALERCGFTVYEVDMPAETSPKHFITLDFNSKALRPPRDISATATVTARDGGALLQFQELQIFRQTVPGNEEAALADLHARVIRCLILTK